MRWSPTLIMVMPASPVSRAARRQSRSTNSSGWRCSHMRRTSPRSRSTSQSSRMGGTVMYCRPYSPVMPSQWSSIATETVEPSSASSRRRRIRSTAPKNRPSAGAPGSAIRRSSVRRTMSSSISPMLSAAGSAAGAAPAAAGPGTGPSGAGRGGAARTEAGSAAEVGTAAEAGSAEAGSAAGAGSAEAARAGEGRAGPAAGAGDAAASRPGPPGSSAGNCVAVSPTGPPAARPPGSAGPGSPPPGTAVSIGGTLGAASARSWPCSPGPSGRPGSGGAACTGPDSMSTGARCPWPHRHGPS